MSGTLSTRINAYLVAKEGLLLCETDHECLEAFNTLLAVGRPLITALQQAESPDCWELAEQINDQCEMAVTFIRIINDHYAGVE